MRGDGVSQVTQFGQTPEKLVRNHGVAASRVVIRVQEEVRHGTARCQVALGHLCDIQTVDVVALRMSLQDSLGFLQSLVFELGNLRKDDE